MQAIKFKNFSNEDFTWKYDGVPYTFKAGEEIYMEDFKAEHFARHLVDTVLNAQGVVTNNATARRALEMQCFPASEPMSASDALQVTEKAKVKKVKAEVEFPDLKKKKK